MSEAGKTIAEAMAERQVPERVRRMHEHYREHGFFHPADLRRILGDQTKGVTVTDDPKEMLQALHNAQK